MKKRKNSIEIKKCIYSSEDNFFKIYKEDDKYLFEIGDEIALDIAEAVSILMTKINDDNKIWEIEILDEKMKCISPERCLFWLSGGYNEWKDLKNYNLEWSKCYEIFKNKFENRIYKIIKKSKKLKDIRNGFKKYLNLPILYDFAISKGIV